MPLGSASAGAAGLLQRQIEAIRQMLYFNGNGTQATGLRSSTVGVSAGEPSWKVLIYDEVGQSILTPLFSVKELRDACVTLNILLHSER